MTDTPNVCPAGPCGHCCTVIDGLTVSYGRNIAAENITTSFTCGELTAIVGPNGAGKSSILRAILGQVRHSGTVTHCGTLAQNGGPRIGYVPQKVSIAPDSPVSVCDFMLLAAGYRHVWFAVPRKNRDEMAGLLSLVNAEKLVDRTIGTLSGGELQRVLLACSLNPMPEILLLDEPISAFDVRGMDLFYEMICELRKKFHLAIVVVTHDIDLIARHADRMILMDRTILAQGAPAEVVKHPAFISVVGPAHLDAAEKTGADHFSGDHHD